MERLLPIAFAFILLSGCCLCPVESGGPGPTGTPTPAHAVTATPIATHTPGHTPTPAPSPTPAETPPPGEYAEIEQRIFQLTNVERERAGLPQFAGMAELGNAARWQACCCAENGILEHESPECGTVNLRLLMFGLPMVEGAENLGQVPDAPSYYAGSMQPTRLYSNEEVAQRFVTGWMNSPPHRANILDPRYTHLGVGVCKGGHYFYAAQNFIISGD